jgi:hypothetical protein
MEIGLPACGQKSGRERGAGAGGPHPGPHPAWPELVCPRGPGLGGNPLFSRGSCAGLATT